MQRVDRCPKTAEKLEYIAEHDLGNIQNITPSVHLLNTSLLYRKDNLGGQYVLKIGFFKKKSFFKERAG